MELPIPVLDHVLYFLPQNLLFNLALTNFHFYEPCLRKLYKKLVIQVDPVLKNTKTETPRLRLDHLELCCTTVCGFASVDMPRASHIKMLEARLDTLATAIEVNPTLATYIEEVDVRDFQPTELTLDALSRLVDVLASVPTSIYKFYVADPNTRKHLHKSTDPQFFSLTSVCVDSLAQLEELAQKFSLQEVVIAGCGLESLSDAIIPTLEKLRVLLIRDDPTVYSAASNALWKLYRRTPFEMKQLKTFNVVHTHENFSHGFPYVDFSRVETFQISLGCNKTECDQECLEAGLDRFEFSVLKRLAVIQNSDSHLNTHKYCEKWDLTVFEFVKSVVDVSDTLFYLLIRHNVPLDATIDDGFEGNYMRKVKLYTILLPNLLASIQRHVVNLVLPNLVASMSCYEQPMNTFLWNGCKCSHCDKHLEKLDDYLLHHRYFSPEKKVFKDVLTTQLVRTLSEVLVDRMPYDRNLGDLFQLNGPMRNTTWDFHQNKFSEPFRCLPVRTYEMAEFEDDKTEIGKKATFDVQATRKKCIFFHQRFYPDYLIVLSHFLNDLIRRMINLNRGDAEDVSIGLAKDENDGDTNLRINKMLVNGIDYNFDHEINGTIFFVNSFDGTDDE